ncbi:MAG TPA: MDR family oxidoreductase [Bryobacteraceae bacterium]|jgi:acrylyl-CoA reductase (NADPH)
MRAIFASQQDGKTSVSLQEISKDQLPAAEVLVHIAYSSLNYKDGLAITGKPGVIRKFPMIPGIDFAGTVEESSSSEFQPGDPVVLTGAGASETLWGGYAEYARWNAENLLKLPASISLKQSMAIGTAGFTAMQSVIALERHGLQPGGREVLVTGAAGGVGSVAVAILGKLGYKVAASTGRPELAEYLRGLGASEIVDRAALTVPSKAGLEKERWGGVIDSVGGTTLAGILPAMANGASVASCGLAGGAAFSATVLPFILRGVNLLGINSVRVAPTDRHEIWARLSTDLPLALLDSMTQVAPLGQVFDWGEKILAGQVRGRVVIDVNS